MAKAPPLTPKELNRICHVLLKELEIFHEAIVSGDRRDTGANVGIGGTRVGQILKEVEEGLSPYLNGGSLIDWDINHIEPTEAGSKVQKFAKEVLEQTAGLLQDLYQFQYETELKVATIDAIWNAHGKEIEKRFKAALPNATIAIVEKPSGTKYPEKVVAAVAEGRADVGLTSYPPRVRPPLKVRHLQDVDICMVFNSKFPCLPASEEPTYIGDLIRSYPQIRVALHDPSINAPFANRVRYYIDRSDLGGIPIVSGERIADLIASVKSSPDVVTILPIDSVFDEMKRGQLLARPIFGGFDAWKWGLIYRIDNSRGTVSAFLEAFRRWYA